MSMPARPAMTVPLTHPTTLRKTISGGFEQRMARGPDGTRGFKGAGRGARSPPLGSTSSSKMGGAQMNPGSQVSPQFSFAQATTAKRTSPPQLSVDTSHPPSNPPDISLNSFASADSPIDAQKSWARQRAAEEASRKQRQLEAAARAQESLSAQASPMVSPAPSPARTSIQHSQHPPSMTAAKQLPDKFAAQTGTRSPGIRPTASSPANKSQQQPQNIVWVGGNPLTVPPPASSPSQRKGAASPVVPLGSTSTTSPAPANCTAPLKEQQNAWEKPRGAQRVLGIGQEQGDSQAPGWTAQEAAKTAGSEGPNHVAPGAHKEEEWQMCMSTLGQTALDDGDSSKYFENVSAEEKERARSQVMQFLMAKQQQGSETGSRDQSKGLGADGKAADQTDVPDSWETAGGWEKRAEVSDSKSSVWGSANKDFAQASSLFTPADLANGRLGAGGPAPDFELSCEEEKPSSQEGSSGAQAWGTTTNKTEGDQGDSSEPQSASDALKNMLGIGMMGGGLFGGQPDPLPPSKLPVWGQTGGGVDIRMDPAIAQVCQVKPKDAATPQHDMAESPPDPECLVQKEVNPNPARKAELQERDLALGQHASQAPPPLGVYGLTTGLPAPVGLDPSAQHGFGVPGGGPADNKISTISGNAGLLAPSQLQQTSHAMPNGLSNGMTGRSLPRSEEGSIPGLGYNPSHFPGGGGPGGMPRDIAPNGLHGGFGGPRPFQNQMMPPGAFGGPISPFGHMPFGMPGQNEMGTPGWMSGPGMGGGAPPDMMSGSMRMPPPNGMGPPPPDMRGILGMPPPHMQEHLQAMFHHQQQMQGPPMPGDGSNLLHQKQSGGPGPAGGFDFGKMFGGLSQGEGGGVAPSMPMPGKMLSLAEIEGRQFAD